MRIGILTTDSKYEDKRLVEEAKALNHKADLIHVLECNLGLCNDTPKILYQGKDISNDFDVIIPRINTPHTVFGLSVLRQFQSMGIKTTDRAHPIELGRDKLRCQQHLMNKKVPFPVTGFAYSQDNYEDIINIVGGAPLIVKLVEGTEGTARDATCC